MAYDHPALPAPALRWKLPPETFSFVTTAEVEPIEGVVGQDAAVEALTFGLEVNAPGQNIFVRGLTGTGRSTLIRRLLERIKPDCPLAPDRCYVHNFERPDRPRLLTLARGTARAFREGMDELIRFVRDDLSKALASDVIKGRGREIERQAGQQVKAITEPFDKELAGAGLAMVLAQVGPVTRQLILPLIDGEPTAPEKLEALKAEGRITEEQVAALREKAEHYNERLEDVGRKIEAIQDKTQGRLRELIESEARTLLRRALRPLERTIPNEDVRDYLAQVVDDVIQDGLPQLAAADKFTERYRVNVIEPHEDEDGCPIIEEMAPSVQTLLGMIDRSVPTEHAAVAPHMLVHGGSLLRADGGYLILDARDVLTEPWRAEGIHLQSRRRRPHPRQSRRPRPPHRPHLRHRPSQRR